ncbi:DUF3841 domain-containing protein [Streptomyces katsurahamanus]|uniref:DUF3841 domain-containing protein n=1 Tax=Streptomyces katsurahamanus TaxID=2577098 RepID=A0ABW9NZ37_9ACTN|nr:DUF3841 domain-containing protein [Streptomyces katsurahamanus]
MPLPLPRTPHPPARSPLPSWDDLPCVPPAEAVPPGRLDRRLSGGELTLRTVQSPAAYEELRRTGVLRGSTATATPEFTRSYAWMAHRMAQRFGLPMPPDASPVWAWARVSRRGLVSMLADEPTETAMLTARVRADRAVLSSYDAWHAVLNMHPLWPDEEWEARRSAWERRWPDHCGVGPDGSIPALMREETESTWEGVFTLGRDWVQACLPELTADDVLTVTRCRPRPTANPGR